MKWPLVSLFMAVAVALANVCCTTHSQAAKADDARHSCCSKQKQEPAKNTGDCCKGRPTYANDSVKVMGVDVSPAVVLPVWDLGVALGGEHVAIDSDSSCLLAPQPASLLGLHCALVL